ncbi:MBL fold metallo-hydrolase [Paenibacillus xylanexedens]|uniref:MBL fold metallo-hydrolase n=1 Tax=Paenibacillus xylanexedens TaxID=528191 RepID=UPI001F2C93B7|nr:MBL fold metallo-hydrolase [Paenibacillus xylanexedens]MCF7754192.1 MBL fold metallo-hydrolase [Paenibacillus xylanexedens]
MSQPNTGIKTIKLEMEYYREPFIVYPTLLWDEQNVVLVDTGIPGQLEQIRTLLEIENFGLEKLTHVIITHQDGDHIGSLPELLQARRSEVKVLAHEEAVPYLTGAIPLIKSKSFAPSVHVHTALKDRDILPLAGGIQVVFTPDHMSLYHIPTQTLIAGDALNSKDGRLLSFDDEQTLDHTTALKSIAKLLELDIKKVITYHGNEVTNQINDSLQKIVNMKSII